ncbi:MAG TPA: hypothetical protein VIC29_16350 [Steroidobacteraceae bacterium]
MSTRPPSIINRVLLPGLAFKAVVIGGGYATGRELAEFFLPAGPMGGILGMALAMLIWSIVCTLTFVFAYETRSSDYRAFFGQLLGRWAVTFEIAYFAFLTLILAVFGAASGAIGQALFGWRPVVGTLALATGILIVVICGQGAVERLFKLVSLFLYAVYIAFFVLTFSRFGGLIEAHLRPAASMSGWFVGGATYASYNVIGAVLILPVLRHLTSRKDAVIAGTLCGPLAIAPALLFFTCLLAFYPGIGSQELPADFILRALHRPLFHLTFEAMVFFALLESSVGFVYAFNARLAALYRSHGRATPLAVRILVPTAIVTGAMFVAAAVGLVELIAKGYRLMAVAIIAIFILPLCTIGIVKLLKR